MIKTLGLDDDLDSVEVVIEIEKAFDVEISDGEAEAVFKVGHLFDLLVKKIIAGDENRKCASAMAFYRIRRTLIDLRVDVGRSPSCDISRLHRVYTRSFVKSVEERSGLRLPQPTFSLVGKAGVALILVGMLGALAAIVAALPLMFVSAPIGGWLQAASIILLVGGLVTGFTLMGVDAGRLPTNCRTLGALASKAAGLSYGRLVKQGADGRHSCTWKALLEILSRFANVPADQISRETYFLRSALKTHNTAA
jgi:hypothetical protein